MSDGKTCRKCGEWQPLPSFNRDKRLSDGRRNTCRDCQRAESAKWRETNPERRKAYDKQAAQERKEYQRAWRAANPDKIRTYRRTYSETHAGTDFLSEWRRSGSVQPCPQTP